MASDLEHRMYFELRRAGLKDWVAEYNFKGLNGRRRWRFDVAFKDADPPVAIEVQGGLYSNGKHSREAGRSNDALKSAEAQLAGWIVIEVTPSMIENGTAVALVKEALNR